MAFGNSKLGNVGKGGVNENENEILDTCRVNKMGFKDFGKGSTSSNLNKIFGVLHDFDDLGILVNPNKTCICLKIQDICLDKFT